MSGNIIVIEPESRFKKIDKSLIENQNIDCLTLGIYTKIVSFGKKWNLNVKGLSTILGLSDKKIRKSIVLLEKEGYIVRTAAKNEKGQLCGWNYKIYPIPVNEKKRSNAGKTTKNESCRLTQKQTTRETDNTENGQDITNKTKNTFKTKLNNNKKENKKEKFCEYTTKFDTIQLSCMGVCKNVYGDIQQSCNNNIDIINNNNIEKENKKEKMKKANYNELKSAIREEYLYKIASIHKINKNTALSLLEAFVNINKDKKGNEFQFCQHFENWLNTDKGQQAINSTRLTTIITNNYNQD